MIFLYFLYVSEVMIIGCVNVGHRETVLLYYFLEIFNEYDCLTSVIDWELCNKRTHVSVSVSHTNVQTVFCFENLLEHVGASLAVFKSKHRRFQDYETIVKI